MYRNSVRFYRPQRSCEGYVFTPVYDSVHRGGLPQCMLGYHPPGAGAPPPGADPPNQATTPQQTSTVADGTRPTGMHSYFHP